MFNPTMRDLQRQVAQLTARNDELVKENERVRNLLNKFNLRHDADQKLIEKLMLEKLQ